MTTDAYTDRLSEYIDGELSQEERAAVDAHLVICPECRSTLDALEDVVSGARSVRVSCRRFAALFPRACRSRCRSSPQPAWP